MAMRPTWTPRLAAAEERLRHHTMVEQRRLEKKRDEAERERTISFRTAFQRGLPENHCWDTLGK